MSMSMSAYLTQLASCMTDNKSLKHSLRRLNKCKGTAARIAKGGGGRGEEGTGATSQLVHHSSTAYTARSFHSRHDKYHTQCGMELFYMLIIITDRCRFVPCFCCSRCTHYYYDYYENANDAKLPVASCHVALLPMLQMQILLQAFIIINTCNAQRNWIWLNMQNALNEL